MNSLSKNALVTFLAQIASLIFGIALLIVLTRILGPEGKGIYTLIILIPTLAIKLVGFGIEEANIYFTGSAKIPVKNIVSNSLILATIISLALILLFQSLSENIIFQDFLSSNGIVPLYLWMAILTIPFTFMFVWLNSVFLGRQDMSKFNFLNVFFSFIQLAAAAFLLIILKQGIFGAVFSYALATVAAALIAAFLIGRITPLKFFLDKMSMVIQLKYGAKAYLGNIAQFLNYRLDMLLIAVFLNPLAVGLYSIAVEIAERLWLIPMAIATVLFPKISSIESQHADNLTPKVCRHTLFIVVIISMVLVALSYPLIKIIFGSSFLPSLAPLFVLMPGIIIFSVARVLSADLSGRGMPEIGMWAALVSLAVNLVLNVIFIPKWGIVGAAFASTAAYSVATIVTATIFFKTSQKNWHEVLIIKRDDLKDYILAFIKIKEKIGFAKR